MSTPTPPTTTHPHASTSDDPAAIRRDIDRTRGDMEGTIDALNDRVNPQRIRERRTGQIRRMWSSARASVMGGGDTSSSSDRSGVGARAGQAMSDAPQNMERQMRGNPLTAGMIAFGVGTLIGSALPDSDAERRAARLATEHMDVDGAKQRLTDHAREVQAGVQDKAREAAQDLKGSARDAAHDVKDHAQHEGQRVRDDAQQSGQEVRRQA